MKRFLLATLFVLYSGTSNAADPPVAISVTPRIQLGREGKSSEVYVKLTVPENLQNRAVCVDVDGPVFRSSCWEITALGQPYRQEWWVRGLGPGRYAATATLEREGKKTYRSVTTFCVAGGEEGCEP